MTKDKNLEEALAGKFVTVLLRDGTDVKGSWAFEGAWYVMLEVYDDSRLIWKDGDPVNDDEPGVFDGDRFEVIHKDMILRIMGLKNGQREDGERSK